MKLGILRESKAEEKTCAWADSRGIVHIKLTPVGQRGWNDRLFFLPLRPLLIEFKSPGWEPRPLQAYRHRVLRELFYDVQVHDTHEAAIAAIEEAKAKRLREHRVLAAVGLGSQGCPPEAKG